MACEFICDGCGKREPGVYYHAGDNNWHKPQHWYERADKDGAQDACSRRCIEAIAEKSGKTSLVAPF
jgi:hypothetical protein